MKSLKVYLMFWVSGLVVGVVLVERWRRTGQIIPTPDSVEEAAETAAASPGSGGCRRQAEAADCPRRGGEGRRDPPQAPPHPNDAARGSPPVKGAGPGA